MGKIIKTLVEFEFVIEAPQNEKAKQEIRDAIKDKIINDGNAYYQDDEGASMLAVIIKRYGI